MISTNKKLYASLFIITIMIGWLLTREIESARNITTKNSDEPLIAEIPTDLFISTDDHILNPGAPLTVVEFIDLKNKEARYLHSQIYGFAKQNPSKVRLVFKHSPVQGLFGDASLAHQAAFCAGKQGNLRFWEFVEALNNYNLRESGLKQTAAHVNLNVDLWWNCVNDDSTKEAVAKNVSELAQLGQGKPPLVFLNNRKLNILKKISVDNLLTSLVEQ